MDLHYSQTYNNAMHSPDLFESPMDLHYSQTEIVASGQKASLNPLWIYTTLKLTDHRFLNTSCLNPLWIYTTLKQCLFISYG